MTSKSIQPHFISVFDLFKVGIGPSSSHTVGPMKAARVFLLNLKSTANWPQTSRVQVSLYGSLALTGLGHGTDLALLLGLLGETPDGVNPDSMMGQALEIRSNHKIKLLGEKEIAFDPKTDLIWHRNQNLPKHPNGMRFEAFDPSGKALMDLCAYSIGGGFITFDEIPESQASSETPLPYPFTTGEELLRLGKEHGLKIWQILLENEKTRRSEKEIRQGILVIYKAMHDCIERGFRTRGTLPGGMKVPRRAADLAEKLAKKNIAEDPLLQMDWLNAFAISVNEENASFGRVVTAPTNGAAGIIPSTLEYYVRFIPGANDDGIFRFMMTAAAIGTLYKLNASISGAEVGCQGEVGVASSMAAGALAEVLGGSNEHIENAAEIAMEHHLGMTCDPVGGLVQIPCIERNAMGAVKALNAARISLHGDGTHAISLDRVIKTMWETGQDMSTKYKETSRGGLAVNVPEC